jgi:hypothetical protein
MMIDAEASSHPINRRRHLKSNRPVDQITDNPVGGRTQKHETLWVVSHFHISAAMAHLAVTLPCPHVSGHDDGARISLVFVFNQQKMNTFHRGRFRFITTAEPRAEYFTLDQVQLQQQQPPQRSAADPQLRDNGRKRDKVSMQR